MSAIPVARQKLIEQIAAPTRRARRMPIPAASFVEQYFHGVDEDDLRASPPEELAAAALAHLKFATVRPRRRPLVRVYNPTVERDGYASTHTVVEVTVEDMPFLVDSLGMVIARAGLAIHRMMHPVLLMKRDRAGRLVATATESNDPGFTAESWQHFEIDRLEDETAHRALERQILDVLDDVRLAVQDWPAMLEAVSNVASGLESSNAPVPPPELREAQTLLRWMADNNFTFLGYREYVLNRGRSEDTLEPVTSTGLGILRGRRNARSETKTLTGAMREHAREPQLLTITKANSISTVHRATYLDYIGIKTFDTKGRVTGEKLILGLFTSGVYHRNPREIPLLRHKIERVVAHYGLDPASHDAKAVMHVLDTYPRDELFQASAEDLIRIVRAVVNLYERQRVRVLLRRDVFGRFYSVLVYVPRDRYTTQVRQKMEAVIKEELKSTAIDSQIQISESTLARVHMIVRLPSGGPKQRIDIDALEQRIADAVTTWEDRLRDALVAKYGEAEGLQTLKRLSGAFPAAYQEDTSAQTALADIEHLFEVTADSDRVTMRLVPGDGASLHLRLLRSASPIALSRALPILENMGFTVVSERPYKLGVASSREVWLQDFEMQRRDGRRIDVADLGPRFNELFLAVWTGRAENDGFNRLVVVAGLTWRQAMVLRAYCRFILQTAATFSQAYMEQVLASNPELARMLWDIFAAQFDPTLATKRRDADVARLRERFNRKLDTVKSLDEDRILRRFASSIAATLRTNYFQTEASENGATAPKSYVSFKLNSRAIDELPQPKPAFEIFVYSPRVEGVHLRMGHVARGGIRWSDRREDFRTEVLGLMKAQNVKNTLIVPVGAKGGFVPKRLPAGASREDVQREGVECYRTFIRGLLDVTDNFVGGKVVPPREVVRRDSDDAYLVVAADKGTATFSDIANRIAGEYNFWLGDAFASGGSAGYDHKKMGITARGGWECVKRHFRELGVDTQSQDFTAVGVGDMSGDVFGNGMLQSPHIKLIAAFNHLHIFIDPTPDPARSFAERERLFALPRSTWEDYDRKVISKGGGVYARASKSIRISREAQLALGVSRDTFTPAELIRAILGAPVDLLWNGGIGTYVKSSDETHAEIGDRTNDALRIDGKDVHAKVVGEGGNLGFSQRGRVEYALRGGRINTDFIDNSAGVDCSDHEVNIKIMFNSLPPRVLPSVGERNRMLAQMTDDVAAHVLRDNYLQSQAISMLEARAASDLMEHAHMIRSLEVAGQLDRALEFLPTAEEIDERHRIRRGLTRPELAVTLAYSKIALYSHLIGSDVPEDPYLSNELQRYFPPLIQKRYDRYLKLHRLRREIIATATTNSLVNRMGPSFARRAQEDTGANAATVVRAYAIARESFDMRATWSQIEALDTAIDAQLQYEMMYETTSLLRFVTYWLIHRQRDALHIEQQVHRLRSALAALDAVLPDVLAGEDKMDFERRRDRMQAAKAPAALAKRIASLLALRSGPDIVDIAQTTNLAVASVAAVYFGLSTALSLDWLRNRIEHLSVEGHWQSVARTTLRDTIYNLQRSLTLQVLQAKGRGKPQALLDAWLGAERNSVESLRQAISEMRALPQMDFATLSVALQAVRRIAERT